MKGEFLLEIGCEDIPARMLAEASRSLGSLLESELKGAGILGEPGVLTYSTPRRLIAHCPNVLKREQDREEMVLGPPRAVAFDATGKPTQAATSFASRQGVSPRDLKVVNTPKGEYVAALKRTPGRRAETVLAESVPRVISSISFPRSMYWTRRDDVRFVRPIRWLLVLYAGRVVPVVVGGVRAGRLTCGHRILSPGQFSVRGFAEYKRKLGRAYVLIDPQERARKVKSEQEKLARSRKLRLPEASAGYAGLVDYAVNSTEYPTAQLGTFSSDFLGLPEPILITVIASQQKYFFLRNMEGKLASSFLAVTDQSQDRRASIAEGHARVLTARFEDARFFWEQERVLPLESRREALRGVVFAEKVGTFEQKTDRIEDLVLRLAENVSAEGRRADINALERAARLCKCDLTTHLVGEFPELQGIIGGLYAREQGERDEVCRAIYDHYRPRSAEDDCPATREGALLAVADKVDTLVACFAANLIPSGSSDPFGLRRTAQGVVRIVLEHHLRLNLAELVKEALARLEQQMTPGTRVAELRAAVSEFLLERARHLFSSFSYDEVNAVLAAGSQDLVDAEARLTALSRVRPGDHFEPLCAAFKRIRNILEQAGNHQRWAERPPDPNLLEPGAEAELFKVFTQLRARVAELRSRQQYEEALRLVASLRPHVDRFFDHVLVMTDDTLVRENRLSLLANILREFSTIADFSEIVPIQTAPSTRRAKGR